MNKHQHHSCKCDHSRLSFCKKCKVPHCLDCGMEWVTKPASYWYYPYYNGMGTGYQTLPNVYCGSQTVSGLTDGQSVSTTTVTFTPEQLAAISSQTACNHEN